VEFTWVKGVAGSLAGGAQCDWRRNDGSKGAGGKNLGCRGAGGLTERKKSWRWR
jgi:hypothetical protein